MGRMVGYARVSTSEQDLELQRRALAETGCEEVFEDIVSGVRTKRPGLDGCLNALEPGDVLVVWRLDRLGRSMPHLVQTVASLKERDIGFRSLGDGAIDTTTASGELIFHIFAALAQFERELIRERTRAGLSAARARGRKGGRKPVTASDPKVKMAKALHQDKTTTIDEICSTLGVSRATFYRYLNIAE
jgi:DNA invertase Pin-like site-specific DNA recombinase